MMRQLLAIVTVLCFAVTVQAAVSLEVAVSQNADGNDVYVITAISDAEPISTLGINVVGDGNLGQVYPFTLPTHLQDNNVVFPGAGATVDQDTQAMFATVADGLLVVSGFSDTDSLLDVNFTGFEPFQSREVAQVVLTGGEGVATIVVLRLR